MPGIPAVMGLEPTFGVERQSAGTLAISRLFTSRSRTTRAPALARMRRGATCPLTLAAGASVRLRFPSQAATPPLDLCVTSLALIRTKSSTSASKRGRTGPGATPTRSKRNGATAPWKCRVDRAKWAILASRAAVEVTTRSPGVGSMTRVPGGVSACSILFTGDRGSSPTITNLKAAFRILAPVAAVSR